MAVDIYMNLLILNIACVPHTMSREEGKSNS